MANGGQVAISEAYVKSRLEAWGREFALHRDCEYLGHQSKSVLKVLQDHQGKPPRVTGFKPLEVDFSALEVERAVMDIARTDVVTSCALRAYYCGQGRRNVERLETANELLTMTGNQRIGLRAYYACVEAGFDGVSQRIMVKA
jgi:hypothetical protein